MVEGEYDGRNDCLMCIELFYNKVLWLVMIIVVKNDITIYVIFVDPSTIIFVGASDYCELIIFCLT